MTSKRSTPCFGRSAFTVRALVGATASNIYAATRATTRPSPERPSPRGDTPRISAPVARRRRLSSGSRAFELDAGSWRHATLGSIASASSWCGSRRPSAAQWASWSLPARSSAGGVQMFRDKSLGRTTTSWTSATSRSPREKPRSCGARAQSSSHRNGCKFPKERCLNRPQTRFL